MPTLAASSHESRKNPTRRKSPLVGNIVFLTIFVQVVTILVLSVNTSLILKWRNKINFQDRLEQSSSAPVAEAKSSAPPPLTTLALQQGQLAKSTTTSTTIANTENTLTFTFPSVNERVRYYMGSWYNRTNNVTIQQVCNPQHGTYFQPGITTTWVYHGVYLWDEKNLKSLHQTMNKSEDLAARNYADEALRYFFPYTPANSRALMMFGDGQRLVDAPAIGKTRLASHLIPQVDKGKEMIIGFMEVDRHFGYVERLKPGPSWDQRKATIIWRGDSTGQRYPIIDKYIHHPIHDIDIAFTRLVQGIENDPTNNRLLRPFLNPEQISQYKYLLSIEGNDVASGLKWMLYSGSVVFMPTPKHVSWALEEFLLPYYHYIPLKDDFSNIWEQVQWARKHDELCYNISQNSRQFMLDLFMSPKGRQNHNLVLQGVATQYTKQYGKVLAQCPITKTTTTSSLSSL